jgi:hypothetical protein
MNPFALRIFHHPLLFSAHFRLLPPTTPFRSIGSYTPPSGTGSHRLYKLYQEGTSVCQTNQAQAISLSCDVTLTMPTTNFTLTATFNNGTESPHSDPFPFVMSQTSNPDSSLPPTAVISSSTAAGQAPLTVNFHSAESMVNGMPPSSFRRGFLVTAPQSFGTNTTHTFTRGRGPIKPY